VSQSVFAKDNTQVQNEQPLEEQEKNVNEEIMRQKKIEEIRARMEKSMDKKDYINTDSLEKIRAAKMAEIRARMEKK
jgi:hypothetical protein